MITIKQEISSPKPLTIIPVIIDIISELVRDFKKYVLKIILEKFVLIKSSNNTDIGEKRSTTKKIITIISNNFTSLISLWGCTFVLISISKKLDPLILKKPINTKTKQINI